MNEELRTAIENAPMDDLQELGEYIIEYLEYERDELDNPPVTSRVIALAIDNWAQQENGILA